MRELYQAIASLPSSIIWMTINYRCNISMYSNILFPVLGTISSNFLSTKYQLNVPGINSKEYSIDEILKFQKSSEDPTLLLARGVSSSTLLSLGMDKIALMDKLKLDKEEFDSFIEYASILREFNSKVSNQNQITKIKINYNGVNIGVEQNKTLVISKILLKKINKEEFKRAILAHEMQHVSLGHVTDGSNFIMMLLSQKVFNIALKGALFSVSDFLVKSIATKQIDYKNLSVIASIFLASLMASKYCSTYLQKEELKADKYAQNLYNNPDALVDALKVMKNTHEECVNNSNVHYVFNNYFITKFFSFFEPAFDDHPCIEDRAIALGRK